MEKALFWGQTGSRANQVCHSRLLLTPMFFPFMSQAARPTLCPADCKGPTGGEKNQNLTEIYFLRDSAEPSISVCLTSHQEGDAVQNISQTSVTQGHSVKEKQARAADH